MLESYAFEEYIFFEIFESTIRSVNSTNSIYHLKLVVVQNSLIKIFLKITQRNQVIGTWEFLVKNAHTSVL